MNAVKFNIVCPVCQEHLTRMTSITHETPDVPAEGDVTLCDTCLALLEFNADLTPHQINIKELDPEVQDIIVVVLAHLQKRNQSRRYH